MMKDFLNYRGKMAVITGCASGMGYATAADLIELGADVYALDIKEVNLPVKKYIPIDLANKDSIEDAARQLPERVDCLFNCAGIPGPPWSTLDVAMVNFVGTRYLTDILLPRINFGGAVVSISSKAGVRYRNRMVSIKELLVITDYDEARAWLEAHEDVNDGYMFSKECLIVYTKWKAPQIAERNVRINCISPSVTETPMMEYFRKLIPKDIMDQHLRGLCGRYPTAEDIAEPLIFINSQMARYISGENVCVDYGLQASAEMGDLFPEK